MGGLHDDSFLAKDRDFLGFLGISSGSIGFFRVNGMCTVPDHCACAIRWGSIVFLRVVQSQWFVYCT